MLIAGIGEGWCFFANAVSYSAVIIGLLMMKVEPGQAHAEARSGSALRNILEGFLYVRKMGPIRELLLLLGLVSIVGMPYSVLMPIFADRILHGGARGLGILMGATGIGALGGAMSLAVRSGTKGLGKVVGCASAGFGAALILFSVSRSFWLSALILIPVGYSFMVQMAASNTLIQTIVPDHLRGRVMAVHVMMFIGMAPFGSFLAGAIAAKVGAPLTIAVGASVCIIGAGVFLARLPRLQLVGAGRIQTHMDES